MRPRSLGILVGSNPDRPAELARLVASIAAHSRTDWRLYVAFVAPPDVPWPVVVDQRVTMIREWPRAGVSAGYNRLADFAREDWFAWLNDDAEVEPDWDVAAIRALEAEPRAGLAACAYITPHPPAGWHVNTFPPGLPYANFGVLRRHVFEQAFGFDPTVWMYGCDNALAFRVMNLGLAVLPVGESRIVHHYRNDAARAAHAAANEAHRAGWEAVWQAWRGRLPEFATQQERAGIAPERHGARWSRDGLSAWVFGDGADVYRERYGDVLIACDDSGRTVTR